MTLAEKTAVFTAADLALEVQAHSAQACRSRGKWYALLDAFLKQSLPDQVYWIEREGRRRQQTVLYSAPIEVGPLLAERLGPLL